MESCSRLTAAEGGARLAAAAGTKNVMITEHTSFIPTSLLIECAHSIRGNLSSGFQRSIYITRLSRIACVAHELNILTDLKVTGVKDFEDVDDWGKELEEKQVIVCTSEVLCQIFDNNLLTMTKINVLIVDSCHLIFKDAFLQNIMKLYKNCDEYKRPRILAMTYPLFQSTRDVGENSPETNNGINKESDKNETLEIFTPKTEIINDTGLDVIKSNDNVNMNECVNSKNQGVENENKTDNQLEQSKGENTTRLEVKSSPAKIKNEQNILEPTCIDNKCSVNEIIVEANDCKESENEILKNKNDINVNRVDKDIENGEDVKESCNDEFTKDDKVTNEITVEETAIDEKHDFDMKKFIKSKNKKDNVKTAEDMSVYENLDDFDMYEKLEWKIEEMEKQLCCEMDLAEDIDGGKRLSPSITKPKEVIIEFSGSCGESPDPYKDLECFMRNTIYDAMEFIYQHRYDPTEIYGEELYEEFMNIPDPTIDPKQIFYQFLYVLDELGPYAADKAAFSLLTKLEKLKIKVPYERHFLLLCLCTSVFVKIRCYADLAFSKYESDWDKLVAFSTPKVLRFAAILEQFQPESDTKQSNPSIESKNNADPAKIAEGDTKKETAVNNESGGVCTVDKEEAIKLEVSETISSHNSDSNVVKNSDQEMYLENTNNTQSNENSIEKAISEGKSVLKKSKTIEMLDEIDKCDFTSLGDRIEDKVNIIALNLKEIDDTILESDLNDVKCKSDFTSNNIDSNTSMDNDKKEELVGHKDNDAKSTIKKEIEETAGNDVQIIEKNDINDKLNASSLSNTKVSEITNENGNSELGKENPVVNSSDNNNEIPNVKSSEESVEQRIFKRGRGRARGRKPTVKTQPQSSDSLCGIVFMKEPLMAKIMFMIIVDMSRSRPSLSHLCAQYCAVENVEEPRESQRQGRKHEDVLKKFRMHECNLLLATSALEEGIDLPRCNLVVRWDVPPSYRSYGLCRSRARASKSSVTLLANAEKHSSLLVHNLAVYKELDQIVTRKCGCGIQNEPPIEEEIQADSYTQFIKAYSPNNDNAKNKQIIDKIDEINKSINDLKENKRQLENKERDKCKEDETEDTQNCEGLDNNGKIQTEDDIVKEMQPKDDNIQEIQPPGSKIQSERIKDTIYSLDFRDKNKEVNTSDNISNNQNDSEIKNIPNESMTNKSEVKISYNVEKKCDEGIASVDLNTAIALINRYCGKLPSDTFTRLAPQWWMEEVRLPVGSEMKTAYICTLRMPLNCPVKYNIVGHPMPTRVLARRMVALQACRILHKSGELDDQLMPIGKENFKAAELDSNVTQEFSDAGDSARPGTTKRRQYYYKRTAWAFTDCQPIIDTSDEEIESHPVPTSIPVHKPGTKRNMLYAIVSNLWCALPERYNTRGRKLHLPQHATQAIGILVARCEPTKLQIPAFPVYTRSGEVRVSVEPALNADVRLSPRREKLIRRFMRFVFSDVLRVRRRGMKLQTEGSTQNNYYIVPTVKRTNSDGTTAIDIDWSFLELIYQHTEEKKIQEQENPAIWEKKEKGQKMENPLLKPGEVFVFDAEKYSEAVVTPWYRNQDQPQFFLVAEICWHLTPDSAFPSEQHATFRSYYKAKYGAELTQTDQPLLDVDHTSARLNLLTPRYVNRKGVALPVSSERTRRAKRDRLDQKQIMVPELCRVHPFAAPLWFATVALPCVLYRINALLIADEIRRAVAIDVGLGIPRIDDESCPGFSWPALDFGWSLAEVLNADSEKHDKKKEIEDIKTDDVEKEQRDKQEQENAKKSEEDSEEPKEKTLNEILQEKEEAESGFEIGTWSNEMASSIPQTIEYDEFMEPLPPNLTFCTSATGGANWSDPIEKPKNYNPGRKFSMADSDCSYISSDFDTDDSDFNSEGSDEDSEGFSSSKNTNAAMGVRIEYKTAHEAEAVDVERRRPVAPAPAPDPDDDARDLLVYRDIMKDGVPPDYHIKKFRTSVEMHEKEIIEKGHLITKNELIKDLLPEGKDGEVDLGKCEVKKPETQYIKKDNLDENSINNKCETTRETIDSQNMDEANESNNKILDEINITKDNNEIVAKTEENNTHSKIAEMFPYLNGIDIENGQITLEQIEKNKRKLLAELRKTLTDEEIKKLNCFSMVDIDIDSPDYVNEKVVNVGFDTKDKYKDLVNKSSITTEFQPYYLDNKGQSGKEFDFDYQPSLEGHPGPSPSVILQALTMSNANDGINLERLETIGDSFLKFAITAYLYCAHPAVHEGKLSHMRSKQVSNLNLYRLGRNKRLGARMIASKFEPHDNWLPPCHKPPPTLQPGANNDQEENEKKAPVDNAGCFIPYNLITQHSIPDKSIADCVEALIGAYLLECGPRGALLFMSWLGIRVLPCHLLELPTDHPYVVRQGKQNDSVEEKPLQKTYEPLSSDSESCCSSEDESTPDLQPPPEDWSWPGRPVGSLRPYRDENGKWVQPVFGELKAPPSPLLRYISDPEGELEQMLSGYEELECTLQYRFRDRSLLLQALTHASHQKNRLTDCYQRLEFLGDAILDYLITRHLYEDARRHSPGALTDLRSALVNNTIFATLAARHGLHKYFRHMSPGLNEVLTKYVKIQEENGHSISEEHYLIQEDEMEQAEDVEVPKALGDLFESVAGAIFLDSGMSLGAVWRSYARLMMAELEAFSAAAPKSPVRELLEAEPDTAKFGKPERLADGRRVRVCVEVFGRGTFKGIGRNYRIAKGTAARCALRHLKIHRPR